MVNSVDAPAAQNCVGVDSVDLKRPLAPIARVRLYGTARETYQQWILVSREENGLTEFDDGLPNQRLFPSR